MDVDPDSAAFYRSLPGDLGDRLRSVLTDSNGGVYLRIENGRCPMWRQDGLCRIQAELGHDALCATCREFPRLRHDYGDFVELDLELSCPEAARLIFSGPARPQSEDTPGGDPSEYDCQLMSTLLQSRTAVTNFLEDASLPLAQQLAAVLLYAHQVQGEIDGGEALLFDPQACLNAAKGYAGQGKIGALLDFFEGLEFLTERWRQCLADAARETSMADSLRPLALYGVRRYWLQAVSDLDLVCRAKFIVAACVLVSAIGGDPVQTSQLFSKEIENDHDNLEAILDAAYTNPAFTNANLLGLLINPEKIGKTS